MKRRQFIGGVSSAAVVASYSCVGAQPAATRRVGVLITYALDDPEAKPRLEAFESKLRELGWINGKNLQIEIRSAAGAAAERLREQAFRLLATKPDVILCQSTPVVAATIVHRGQIPLVFVQVTDPVGSRFVKSLAHPGGDITGFTDFEYDIGGKWLGLLLELYPVVSEVSVIVMRGHPGNEGVFRAMEPLAARHRIRLVKLELGTLADLAPKLRAAPGRGVIVMLNPAIIPLRSQLIALMIEQRLPAIFPLRYFVSAGAMISYGINQIEQWSGAAGYVSRILAGERASDLPVQLPSRYELAINIKTARSLGLDVPPTLLARADEVIE